MKKSAITAFLALFLFSTACGVYPGSLGASGQMAVAEAADTEEQVLGKFATEFDSQESGRGHNITLAAKKLNGVTLEKGQNFSFNETVGPTTKNNGFKLATVFVEDKETEGYGGGVCQVSSTLFNAVSKAGLTVLERHRHTLPISYVPEGMDAATSYGVIDFSFKNDSGVPIKIKSFVEGNVLTVVIVKA